MRPIAEAWRTGGGASMQHAGASFKVAAGGRKSPTNHVTAKANLLWTRLCHVAHSEITTSLDGRIAHRCIDPAPSSSPPPSSFAGIATDGRRTTL